MASRLRCGGFFRVFRFFLLTRFRKPKVVLFTSPLFFFGCFFCSHSSWEWGLIIFLFFGVFLQKTLFFSLKKGYFGSFLSVSLSFSLASFTSLCHSLSLSLSIFPFFSCFFPSLLSCLYFYLLCFCCFFLSCFLSLLFHEKNNIKTLHLKTFFHRLFPFVFLFRLSNMFSSLLFHYLSCAFSIYPREPFLKHQFWFCAL